MRLFPFLLLLVYGLSAAGPSIDGKWVWVKEDYVRTPPFKISGGRPPQDEALRDIRLEGTRLTFVTGKPGGGGADLLTHWSGIVKGDSVEGTYTFVESASFGNFKMTRSR